MTSFPALPRPRFPTQLARGLVRRKVDVVNYPDGRFAVQFNGRSLPFRMFDKIQTVPPGTIVDNKRLSTGAGDGKGAPGGIRAEAPTGACGPAAATEQS